MSAKRALAKVAGPNAHTRVLAGIEYATNPDSPSIEQLHKDVRFVKVSLRTLERWATEDRWTERRREFVEKWSEYARAQLGTKLAQKRIEDLGLLENLRQEALLKLTDTKEDLQPKSWDSVVMVISKLTTQLDEVRRQIGGEALASIGKSALPSPDEDHPEFEKDDIERAARRMLELRHSGITAEVDQSGQKLLASGEGDADAETDSAED